MIVTKKEKHFIYTVENWTERFRIYVTGALIRSKREGDEMPRFYLPIWSPYDRDAIECWIFPLAPIVLFWRILSQVIWIIWKDLIDWYRLLRNW